MALNNQQRSAKRNAARQAKGVEELRLLTMAGTRAALADLMAWHGCVLTMRGHPEEGLDWLNRACALNPLHPDWYHIDIAIAYQMLGRYTDALAHLRSLPETSAFRFMRMAACEALLGNPEGAAAYLDRAEALSPGWNALTEAADVEQELAADRKRFVAEVARAIALRDGLRSQ